MDDTTLISSSWSNTEKMLSTCHSFYLTNDIKANVKKYEIIKINSKKEDDIKIDNNKITKVNSKEGNRFLGVYFTPNCDQKINVNRIEMMVKRFTKRMSWSKVTDKQIIKIWNVVMIPAIEYQLQTTILTMGECNRIMAQINKIIKNKANLPSNIPNSIIYDKDILYTKLKIYTTYNKKCY